MAYIELQSLQFQNTFNRHGVIAGWASDGGAPAVVLSANETSTDPARDK